MLFMYITRLASNEIFSPSNKIHREVGRAKDLSAPLHISQQSLCNLYSYMFRHFDVIIRQMTTSALLSYIRL